MTISAPTHPRPRGLARARQLWTLWRNEPADPAPFYELMGREAVEDLEAEVGPLAGQRIADLGCGPGVYSRSLRAGGAEVVPIDNSVAELSLQGEPPSGLYWPTPVNCLLRTGSSTVSSARTYSSTRPTPRLCCARSLVFCAPAGGRTFPGPTGTRRGVGTPSPHTITSVLGSGLRSTRRDTVVPIQERLR